MAEQTMVERAGSAARIAVPRYAVSTYGQPGHDGKHVVWEVVKQDWPVAFAGSLEECEAWVSAYVGRAAIEAMREPTEAQKHIARVAFGMNPFQKDGTPMDNLWLRTYERMIDAALVVS